ncbi:GNAT family N-acetyltransferase [Aeromicrobium sp.]|uniref:GNAT family N-acetyltransferase n=1 Tax=Aeromicrobium sp. TaxID=1871063 RepID=UPI0028AAF2CD|nr:GNAT family N-acetyltransferase [Aeromicrobium sp.]
MTDATWPLCVPVLSDGLVTLRAHTPADVDRMNAMANDPEMIRWTAVPTPHSRSASEKFAFEIIPHGWDSGTVMCWAIEFEGRYAGNVDIRGKGVLTDIGFALHPDCRGQSLATAAAQLAIDHAFVEAGKEAVVWRSQIGNLPSLRVAHACGFRLTGTQPDALLERGRIHDAWIGTIHFGDARVPRTTWRESTLDIPGARLRPLSTNDVPRIVEACSDPSTRHFLSELPHPYGTTEGLAYVHDSWWQAAVGNRETWAIVDGDDRLVGSIGVMDLNDPAGGHGEVGYWTHPDARGRGIMTEAVRAVVKHAFDPDGLDLRRVTLIAAEGNTASLRIAETLGFHRYGTENGTALLADGTRVDHHLHELLR